MAVDGITSGITGFFEDNFTFSEGFFAEQGQRVHDTFVKKIPFYENFMLFRTTFEDLSVGIGVPPSFTVTMPGRFGGGTYEVIDFTYFSQYRDTIFTWIKFGGWFMVLFKVSKRLPKYIS